MNSPAPSSCAIWEVWDAAGGNLAAAGTKKLSKVWGGVVLATELGEQTPSLPGNKCVPPVKSACDACI